MARKNIFEILDAKWDLKVELERIIKLFDEVDTISCGPIDYALKDFIEAYCFQDWKNRGRCIDVDDYLETIDFDTLYKRAHVDIECFLTIIEVIYNFFHIALQKIEDSDYQYYTSFITLQDNMNSCLEHYNYTAFYFEDKEQVIVYEKDSAITSVAEISDPETAFQIVQYNHHTLKGDIISKKRILLHLASEIEPKRRELNSINKALSEDIFTLLNNLNLRHNNCTPHANNYIQFIAEMPSETLEEWYDELYQMILLAKLELNHIERKNKIAELKTHF